MDTIEMVRGAEKATVAVNEESFFLAKGWEREETKAAREADEAKAAEVAEQPLVADPAGEEPNN